MAATSITSFPGAAVAATHSENLVWAKREINSLKANRLPHEAGLRLLRRPKAPAILPVAATIREPKHPDWRHFLTL